MRCFSLYLSVFLPVGLKIELNDEFDLRKKKGFLLIPEREGKGGRKKGIDAFDFLVIFKLKIINL